MVVQTGRSGKKGSPTAKSPAQSGADDDELTAYARQLPKFAKTGKAYLDNENEMHREALMRLISGLQRNPDLSLKVEQYFVRCMNPDIGTTNEDSWDRTVANVGRLPKYWCAKWLVQNDTSPNNKLSQGIVDLIDAKDTRNIKRIFSLVTLTQGSTVLPMRARQSKALCERLWTKRMQELGDFLRGWCAKAVDPKSGHISWAKGGPYTLHFTAGKATHISYINGDKEVIDVEITAAFNVKDPWDTWAAQACSGATKEYMLHKFFMEKETGPYKCALDKKGVRLDQLAEELFRQAEAATKQISNTIGDAEDYIGEAKRLARKQALKDAQAKVVESSKKRRVISAGAAQDTT